MNRNAYVVTVGLLLLPALAPAQPATPPQATSATTATNHNSSFIDAQGTAHVTRLVALPETLSDEARRYLAAPMADQGPAESIPERRARIAELVRRQAAEWSAICAVTVADDKIAGVPVRTVTPKDLPVANRNKVLINVHGGGFNADAGSLPETIPIAAYSKIKVVAVLYRMVPESVYPAPIEDVVAVYRELLKTHAPRDIAIYGTSAGAVIVGQTAVKLQSLGVPKPAALGIFSGHGDFSRKADSLAIFGIPGLSGKLDPPKEVPHATDYVHGANVRDSLVSPIFAELKNMPPTLFVTSTRDVLMSGTVNLHRAFLHAGVDTSLIVYEGLPHAFWYEAGLPESIEANKDMAAFLARHVTK